VVICLKRGADLHMAQLMSLPLTVSCFSKIQIGFTFLLPAHPDSPGQRAVKRVCVCVCACVCACCAIIDYLYVSIQKAVRFVSHILLSLYLIVVDLYGSCNHGFSDHCNAKAYF